LEALVAAQAAQVEALTKQVAEVMERLGRNSRNSNSPPSNDPPGARQQRKDRGTGRRSGRRRGAQPGHRGHRRDLLPPEQVDEVVDHYPPQCGNCWAALARVPDADATRYQQTEVPPIKPHTREHRRHAVTCAQCGHRTRAAFDAQGIPSSPFGPRLMALIVLLTGVYHLSRRKARDLLSDVLGAPISVGAISAVEARVSDAVAPAVDEAWARVRGADVKHTDGTGWLQAGVAMSLWTIATATATVYKIVADGAKATLLPLYGTLRGILVSDRAKALNFWAMEQRQICWAHLLRKFVSFAERDGVEPMNNHAERELRAFVLWRKRSFGTQSDRGNLFAERLMTVAATARKQGQNVLAFLTACCRAHADRTCAPSLFGSAAR
jgi:transposase